MERAIVPVHTATHPRTHDSYRTLARNENQGLMFEMPSHTTSNRESLALLHALHHDSSVSARSISSKHLRHTKKNEKWSSPITRRTTSVTGISNVQTTGEIHPNTHLQLGGGWLLFRFLACRARRRNLPIAITTIITFTNLAGGHGNSGCWCRLR